MKTTALFFKASLVALLAMALPIPSLAQIYINFSLGNPTVGIAPPPIPQYYNGYSGYNNGYNNGYNQYSNYNQYYGQPPAPGPGYVWTPGFWAWGQGGYFWVPGTWVQPPQVGYNWTPGYWGWNGNGFGWNNGYWANQVGYYGGVNYGNGYYGNGYTGGGWQGNVYRYNTYVTNVNPSVVRYVYVDRTVTVPQATIVRTSYVGGQGGLRTVPTAEQLAVQHTTRIPMTTEQTHHVYIASQDRTLLASVNHGKPAVLTVQRPLAAPPKTFVPITAEDKKAAQPHLIKGTAFVPTRPSTPMKPVALPAHVAAPATHETVPVTTHETVPATTHETAPVTHETVPATTHETAPVTHETAPVTHEAAPVTHETAPVTHEAAPVTHEVTPVTHEVTPVPHVATPVPHYVPPVTHEVTPRPAVNTYHPPAPVYHAPAPAYHAPAPAYHPPAAPKPAPAPKAPPAAPHRTAPPRNA